jgi:predicted ester cyclase
VTDRAAFNRELGLKINREIWNGRRFDKIPEYFAEDFVMDYSPSFVRRGRDQVREAVERSHAAFEGFREEVKTVVADDERVVLHFTIKGRHTGAWGPLPATGEEVAFDEIVIMTVCDGKVVHQVGVIDNLTGLRQVGVIPRRPPDGSREPG